MYWFFQYINKVSDVWYVTATNPHRSKKFNAHTSNGSLCKDIPLDKIKLYSGKNFCKDAENTPKPKDLLSLKTAIKDDWRFKIAAEDSFGRRRYLALQNGKNTHVIVAEALREFCEKYKPDDICINNNRIFGEGYSVGESLKGEKKLKSMFGKYGKISDPSLKMSVFGVAIRSGGSFLTYNKEEKTLTDVMDMVFEDFDYFFAMPVQTVEVSDLLKINGDYVYVTRVNKVTIDVINPKTNTEERKTVPSLMFGMKFYTKIMAPFDMSTFTGKAGGDAGFMGMNPMMLMMMSDKESGSGNMMEMMMMSQMFQAMQPATKESK